MYPVARYSRYRRILSWLAILHYYGRSSDIAHPAIDYLQKYTAGIPRYCVYQPFCPLLHAVLAGIFLIHVEMPSWKVH